MKNPESTMNVHDWVWLGRATLERAATHSSGRSPPININSSNNNCSSNINVNNNDIRITENPLNNAEGLSASFGSSKYNEQTNVIVDTSTYCKNSGRRHINSRDDFDDAWQMWVFLHRSISAASNAPLPLDGKNPFRY